MANEKINIVGTNIAEKATMIWNVADMLRGPFKPHAANVINCNRQWYYSSDSNKSVDMVLVLNGIPVFAFELKNQYTGQNADHVKCRRMFL